MEWIDQNCDHLTSYTVYRTDYGVLVCCTRLPPTQDISALGRAYAYEGLHLVSHCVPKALGVLGLAFVKGKAYEDDWLRDIEEFYGKQNQPQ